MYKKNEIIKYADMEAPMTMSSRNHRAARKINCSEHK